MEEVLITHLFWLVSVLGEMSVVFGDLGENGPTMTQTGIGGLTGYLLPDHTEVRIVRMNLCIQPPVTTHLLASFGI